MKQVSIEEMNATNGGTFSCGNDGYNSYNFHKSYGYGKDGGHNDYGKNYGHNYGNGFIGSFSGHVRATGSCGCS